MTRLMTDKELETYEATRDIGAEILQGIAEMKANNAARRTVVTETDVALARRKANLTQEQFAEILGTSKRTLESWEQGARKPSKAAQSLIKLFIIDPEFVRENLA
ncbi:helix-turn-helix domain-containing protein [Acinetobacter bereziniae]|uniref:helix-turn-helix domain-containing protein n=1 Tax=Acinetobacter bereziniae TaxID=106648 RepID=UPI0019002699|nr:helix-turn-helix domain-containing protein [Acinetobacter bereziniae]MBJ8445911.1 helix-turn-helix domain-containing protein [Acinetobacter bereziniae]